jgi:hypothetical protein
MNAKVFINYRRDDAAPYAGRLYDRLTAHFGEGHVFIDIDQIEPGEDFVEAINRKVGTCDIAVVAIGPNWLRATDASGKRRLDDEEDFVRMEIVAALQRKIRVIPVLVGGARMPGRHDLPEALAPLSRRNAIELSETRFHADVNRLIAAIEKSFAVAENQAGPSAPPAAPPMEPERSDQGSIATAKDPRTSVKSTQTTPATPRVPSTSSITALKEPKVWANDRLVLGSAILLLLVGLAGFVMWTDHQKAGKLGNQPKSPSNSTEPKLSDQGNAAATQHDYRAANPAPSPRADNLQDLREALKRYAYEYGWAGGAANESNPYKARYFRVTDFQIVGKKVLMKYDWMSGELVGEVNGHDFSGSWKQANGNGNFHLTFDSEFKEASGWWNDGGNTLKNAAFMRVTQ